MKKILSVLILLFTISANAQSFFEGKLLKPSADDASINIYNVSKNIGTTDNLSGKFKILASVNDSIVISSIQYKEIIHIVKNGDFEKLNEFQLIPETNELAEVHIKNTVLTGILGLDVKEAKVEYYNNFGFDFAPNRAPVSPLQKEINYIKSDFASSIIYSLNGKLKQLKKNKAIADIEILIDKVIALVGNAYFMENLKIPETEIATFLFFCNNDERFKEFANNEDKIRLLDFLFEKRKEFQQ